MQGHSRSWFVQLGTVGPSELEDCLERRAEAEADEAARPMIMIMLVSCIVAAFKAMLAGRLVVRGVEKEKGR
jgi:hypothetical protein